MATPLASCLLTAVQGGQTDTVARLLKENHDIIKGLLNSPDSGAFYLHEASKLGYEEIVLFLVAYYDDINTASPEGTPLTLACENGYYGIVDLLLCNGASVPSPQQGASSCPFFMAALHGWVDILDRLYEARQDLESDQEVSKCCLEAAVSGGNLAMVKTCFSRLRRCHNHKEASQLMYYFLEIACQGKYYDVIEYLVTCGAQLSDDITEQFVETIGKVLDLDLHPLEEEEAEEDPLQSLCLRDTDQLLARWSSKNLHRFQPSWTAPYTDRLARLDLSHNHLTSLPAELPWQLPNLIKFDVSRNRLHRLATPRSGDVIKCSKLQCINASYNQLAVVPVEVFHLSLLRRLDLSHNRLRYLGNTPHRTIKPGDSKPLTLPTAPFNIRGPGPIKIQEPDVIGKQPTEHINFDEVWSCLGLQLLDVSSNQLQHLPPQIHLCGQLSTLRAANNKLSYFLQPWCCHLELLDLSENHLTNLPTNLDELWKDSLSKLYLHHNQFPVIPQTVCKLNRLQVLDFSENELTALPDTTWWECRDLEELNLSHNQLTFEPDPTEQSPWNLLLKKDPQPPPPPPPKWEFPRLFKSSLSELNLSHNDLKAVPPSVCELTNLKQLFLNHNSGIQQLPLELGRLEECFELGLAGTNITNVPRHLTQTTPVRTRAILAHLKHQLRRSVPYNGIKLMIVGRECKGKSSLAALLQGKPLPQDVATSGVSIDHWPVTGATIRRKSKLKLDKNADFPDVTYQVWDFAGQTDFYVTHKLFLSPCALYIVTYDLRMQKEGIKSIGPWLLDIEAHAPKSHVIIVGTFLDYINQDGRARISDLHTDICSQYKTAKGFPLIDHIAEVSCKTKEGIEALREAIYLVSTGMVYSGLLGENTATRYKYSTKSREKIIGRKVPQSYLDLGKALQLSRFEPQRFGQLPILNTQQVLEIATEMPGNDITCAEELDIATRFLHEAGFIMHYPSTLRGLSELYFTNPSWLADTLAKLITVNMANQCIREGILDLVTAQAVLFTEETHKSARLGQYVDLLEKFEIALLMDRHSLLVPSKLVNTRPSSIQEAETRPGYQTLQRLYRVKCVPSGFWPRAIIHFITMLKRVCEEISFPMETETGYNARDSSDTEMDWDRLRMSYRSLPLADNKVKVIYWSEGLAFDFAEGIMIVESSDTALAAGDSGILVTVATSKAQHMCVIGFAVDQLESLITQWYPGLIDDSNPIERLVPCPRCGCGESPDRIESSPGKNVYLFNVQDVVADYLSTENARFSCPRCGAGDIAAQNLVPDFTLADLPQYLHLSPSDITYNPETDLLGHGGEGFVYKGIFGSTSVAVKQSCMVKSLERCKKIEISDTGLQLADSADQPDASMMGLVTSHNSSGASSLDSAKWILQYKLLPACQDYRKEVTLLSSLDHACVVSILGLVVPQLLYIMELAPLGSLHDILEQAFREKTEQTPGLISQQDGSMLLGKILTCKIIHQISLALQYLHSHKIVYKDLKPRNVLMWSLLVETPVNLKLSDYGLSSYLTPQGVRGCEGTMGYQAPEMRSGSSYNEKVDVFALGMVIYQTLTGLQIFSNLPSVVIPKLIQNGKRPSLQDASVHPLLPKLVSLMELCWSNSPADRPVSAEVVTRIQDPGFWALRGATICPEILVVQGESGLQEVKDDSNVYFVTSADQTSSGSLYCVMNTTRAQYTLKQAVCRSKVTCLSYLGHVIVMGTQDRQLYVYSSERGTGRQIEACAPVVMDDVPLSIITRDSQNNQYAGHAFSKELFIGTAGGAVSKYILSLTSKTKAQISLEAHHLLGPSTAVPLPIKCLLFMDEGSSLWVGHGSDIVILDSHTLDVTNEIILFEEKLNKAMDAISQMTCHGDQVWCFYRSSWDVIEIDVGTLTKVCRFDCSVGSVAGVLTVDWFPAVSPEAMLRRGTLRWGKEGRDGSGDAKSHPHMPLRSKKSTGKTKTAGHNKPGGDATPPPPLPPKRNSQHSDNKTTPHKSETGDGKSPPPLPPKRSSGQFSTSPAKPSVESDDTFKTPPPLPPKSQKRDSATRPSSIEQPKALPASVRRMTDAATLPRIQTLQRKFSVRSRTMKAKYGGGTMSGKHRHPLYHVRSMCYVDGALWVGRKSGDILVINVTQNNPFNYRYGEVVAVLCNEYRSGYANGSVEYLVTTRDTITAVRAVCAEDGGKGPKEGEIVMWTPAGLEDFYKAKQYWALKDCNR